MSADAQRPLFQTEANRADGIRVLFSPANSRCPLPIAGDLGVGSEAEVECHEFVVRRDDVSHASLGEIRVERRLLSTHENMLAVIDDRRNNARVTVKVKL